MIPLPAIQIHSQPIKLNTESELGRYQIRRGYAEVHIDTKPAQIRPNNPKGVLEVDSTLTMNALTGGKIMAFNQRIYSQMPGLALQAIRNNVSDGEKLASGIPIGKIAYENAFREGPKLQIYGPARPDNTKMSYTVPDFRMEVIPHKVDIQVVNHQPDIEYHRGYVRTTVVQYPKVTVTAPQIDLSV